MPLVTMCTERTRGLRTELSEVLLPSAVRTRPGSLPSSSAWLAYLRERRVRVAWVRSHHAPSHLRFTEWSELLVPNC